jgi:hypothetical protein
VRIRFDELPKDKLPRSSTARFSEKWQTSIGDDNFLDQVVERWRSAGLGLVVDATQQACGLADSIGISGTGASEERQTAPQQAAQYDSRGFAGRSPDQGGFGAMSQKSGLLRKDAGAPAAPAASAVRREPAPAPSLPGSADPNPGRLSLRERLLKPQQR